MKKTYVIKSLLKRCGVVAAVAGIVGCGGGGSSTRSATVIPPAVAAAVRSAGPVSPVLVTANNGFGLQLLTQMRTTDTGKNVFISPTSVSICFDIAYAGSAGTTQQAMATTLGLPASISNPSDLNNANAALQASLISTDPAVQLTIANSFWYHKASSQILPSYVAMNTQYYGSQIGDLSGAPNNINAWVSAQTNGKITNVVGQGIQQVVAAIVNAVYFKGAWTTPFDSSLTTTGTFTLADGVTTVPASMMNQTSFIPYFKGDHFQTVKLAYGQGRDSMLVFLPDAGTSVDSLIAEITPANLTNWLTQYSAQSVALSLPKFTSTYSVNLKPVLTALGMGIAFNANLADFSNMGTALFLDSATHTTYLSVNEAGTVAAAVTVIGVGATAAPASPTAVNVNRPFVCAIVDGQTGEMLFIGAIDTPAQ